MKTEELVRRYLESKKSFDEFIEALISSDISQNSRPENVADVVVIGQEDEIEEELLISKDGEEIVLDNDVKDKENLLVSGCDKKKYKE